MRLGFRFQQWMTGAFHLLDAPLDERAIRLDLTLRAASLPRFVADKVAEVSGTIDVERFASARPLRGTARLRLVEDRRMRYDLAFEADDGARCELRGEQDVMLIDLPGSLTTLPASLYDAEGREIGRALLRFDARRDLTRLVRSVRLDAALR